MSDEKGFLTEVDREFLTGEKEYTGKNSKQLRYQRREAIADRTRQAFHDFALLFDVLDQHERDRIFDVTPIDQGDDEYNEFRDALASTIAFLYYSLEGDLERDSPKNTDDRLKRLTRPGFGSVLEEGLKRGETARQPRDMSTQRIGVKYDGVEVHELGNAANLERGLRKIADSRRHELTEEEMSSIIANYEPGGVADIMTDKPKGFARLDERIQELRDDLRKGDEE